MPTGNDSKDLLEGGLIAAGPKMSLQQNLGSDRQTLADQINTHHGAVVDKKVRLDEKVLVYHEHHNMYDEKKADLIATADAPSNVDALTGKTLGWDAMASDSAAKRTKHKLDLMEVATQSQLDHAKELLEVVKNHEKFHKTSHDAMSGFASGHSDFEEVVSHSRHLGEKEINRLKNTLTEHIADHKRFLSRIALARKK